MELQKKLEILADAAKYDASCASSGATKKDSLSGKGVGSTGGAGICHSYTPDGRCVSLLKVLLTNSCIYDCHYCINRRSSNVRRAVFTADEVVKLTLDFYKRNYIEGLFLSSGIIRNADYTMEQVIEVARKLREEHDFRGYIHLKTIPEASPELIQKAGTYADRISINIELPQQKSLERLAPEKNMAATEQAMVSIKDKINENRQAHTDAKKISNIRLRSIPRFATGQSTQMIVGADDSHDGLILAKSHQLYQQSGLRRVYYSAFSPIPEPSVLLPLQAPPLIREHRLYQADWLMRFYHFTPDEITDAKKPMLELDIDPKLSWALRNPQFFPVDVNRGTREALLRVPGLGVRNTDRVIAARRHHSLSTADLKSLRLSMKKILPFILARDHKPNSLDPTLIRRSLAPPEKQTEFLFTTGGIMLPRNEDMQMTLGGEI